MVQMTLNFSEQSRFHTKGDGKPLGGFEQAGDIKNTQSSYRVYIEFKGCICT